MKKVAIFASGSGTNAMNIIRYFSEHASISVDSVWTNRADSLVFKNVKHIGLHAVCFNKEQFVNPNFVLKQLQEREIDLIVLAGFLWLVPPSILNEFKTINIHPSLLPKYGGKGMYGINIHEAVINNKESESGITIHWVDLNFDSGKIILQKKVKVLPDDTPEALQKRIHELEYKFLPIIVEDLLS